MSSEDKIKLCRIVGVLILMDGQLTDAEYDFFFKLMDHLKLSPEEQTTVKQSIQIDADIEKDAAELRKSGGADTLLETLRSAAIADGEIASAEDSMIAKIEQILLAKDA